MLRAVALALLAVLVAGCSNPAASGRHTRTPDPSTSQRWAFSDGSVTSYEYATAIHRFVSCVRAAGYKVGTLHRSPVDGLTLIYDIAPSGPPARYNARTEACSRRHLSLIEPRYVESHRQTMNATLRRAVSRCLRRRGLHPNTSAHSFSEFLAASTKVEQKNALLNCVGRHTQRLFPDLPDYVPIRG